jgi:hypothetical protein
MWTQELLGNWRRHVIRRHEYSRELHFSELTFVDQQRLYCLRCLSQDVVESERPHFPIDVAFGVWWLSKGPTAFQSGEDALRYRRELLAHIQEKLAVTDE